MRFGLTTEAPSINHRRAVRAPSEPAAVMQVLSSSVVAGGPGGIRSINLKRPDYPWWDCKESDALIAADGRYGNATF